MSRLPLPPNNRKYEIKELQARHREIIRRLATGEAHMDIAADLGISRAVVTYTQNSELGREQLAKLNDGRDETVMTINGRIQKLQPRALEILEGALNGAVPTINGANITAATQVKVAQDILGRGGHVAPTRVQGNVSHEHKLSGEDIDRIKQKAYELGKARGQIAESTIVEAEVVESTETKEENAESSNT